MRIDRYCIHCLKDLPATNHAVAHLGSRFGTGCAMSCIWTRDEGHAAACVGGSQPVRQSLKGARGTSCAAVWTPRVRPERLQSRSQLGLAIPTVPTTRMSHFPIRSPSSSAVCLDDGDRWLLPYQQQGQFPTHGSLLETKVPGSLGARLRRRCMEWFAGLLKPCADKIGQIDLFGV